MSNSPPPDRIELESRSQIGILPSQLKTKLRKKKPSKGMPISNMETLKKGIASNAAGSIPIIVRIILMLARDIISSQGRSGETKRLPKLRDQSSSRKESVY